MSMHGVIEVFFGCVRTAISTKPQVIDPFLMFGLAVTMVTRKGKYALKSDYSAPWACVILVTRPCCQFSNITVVQSFSVAHPQAPRLKGRR